MSQAKRIIWLAVLIAAVSFIVGFVSALEELQGL